MERSRLRDWLIAVELRKYLSGRAPERTSRELITNNLVTYRHLYAIQFFFAKGGPRLPSLSTRFFLFSRKLFHEPSHIRVPESDRNYDATILPGRFFIR